MNSNVICMKVSVNASIITLKNSYQAVSHPEHARYGQHLTMEEVNELVKPTDETFDLVHEWLAAKGIKPENLDYTPAKDWIKITLPVKDVEDLLETKYSVFKHADGDHLVRAPEWSLPRHLHAHIDSIQPTNSFLRASSLKTTFKPSGGDWTPFKGSPMPHMPWETYPRNASPNVSAVCNATMVTPLCLRTLYQTINYTPRAAGKNRMALNDFLGEINNRSDTALFLQQFRPDAVSAAQSFTQVSIAGGTLQQTPETPDQLDAGKGLEGNLDVETMLGIGYPTPLTAYSTGGSPPFIPDELTTTDSNEPYAVWLQYILAQKDIPQTFSTSYGDDEQTVPYSYAVSVCNSLAQLGARGVSAMFSSGDNGVGPDGECYSNDGKNTSMFLPAFPASCPYITAVGATKNFNPEVAAYDPNNGFHSGGGFSNYFARPAYQNSAVPAYIASLGNEYAGLYNRSGRGYPDVAAQGQDFVVVWDGQNVLLDGTSASSPTFAAVIALVNDALIAAGRSPLGFLNPWIYSVGKYGLNDITSGNNAGCDTDGFPAQAGWDAVTGFGTPDFLKLKALAGVWF